MRICQLVILVSLLAWVAPAPATAAEFRIPPPCEASLPTVARSQGVPCRLGDTMRPSIASDLYAMSDTSSDLGIELGGDRDATERVAVSLAGESAVDPSWNLVTRVIPVVAPLFIMATVAALILSAPLRPSAQRD